MREICCSAVLFWPLFVAGCAGSSAGESSGSNGTTAADGGHAQLPTCKLASRTELADENEVAPNGQTGAKILAAVPEAFHTPLDWDLSNSVTGVEVEVPGSFGLSSVLHLSFSFPPERRFFFEDWTVVQPDGDVDLSFEVSCVDIVTTTLDVNMVTEDGTISLNLTGLTVRLGPDHLEFNDVARPLINEKVAMTTPQVNFLKPEALPAIVDKTIAMRFDLDGVSVVGKITVYTEGSTTTHEHLVARW